MSSGSAAPLGFTAGQWSWVLFDVGSWGFCTVAIYTYMPVYFKGSGSAGDHHMTALWSFASSVSMVLAALCGPVLGYLADQHSLRKTCLAVCSLVCVVSSLLFPAALELGSTVALAVVVAVGMSYSLTVTMYNALLASLFSSDERHHASATATAWSNAGSAILLALLFGLHQLVVPKAEHTDQYEGTAARDFLKSVMLIGALWWIVFWIPLARYCPEPIVERSMLQASGPCSTVLEPLKQIWQLRDLRQFVIANLFMNEASGVCYQMSLIFAMSIGVVSPEMAVLTTIYNRAVSVLFSAFWAHLITRRVSPWACYIMVQSLLMCAILLCALLHSKWEYWVLSTILACAGTGSFSFSRSVMASLAPPHMVAQVFGLTAALGRVSGFVGPLVFGLVTHLTGNARLGFIPIGGFMFVALCITCRVDLERGVAVANDCVKHGVPGSEDSATEDKLQEYSEAHPLL